MTDQNTDKKPKTKMNTNTQTYTKPLPFWIEAAYARQTPSAWIVTLYARTHDIGCGNRGRAVIRIRRHFDKHEHAVHWAQGTPTGRKLRIAAEGCWLMHQIKEKWDKATRSEILSPLAKQMRAKYDGISYLYESEEAQNELKQVLGLKGTFAMNYPVGLVPKVHKTLPDLRPLAVF